MVKISSMNVRRKRRIGHRAMAREASFRLMSKTWKESHFGITKIIFLVFRIEMDVSSAYLVNPMNFYPL